MRKISVIVAIIAILGAVSESWAVGTGTVDRASGWYPAGSNVIVNATPGLDSEFDSWLGDTNGASILGPQITVTVDGPKTITARFLHIIHDIIASAGANGSINPSGTVNVEQGTNRSFTITPDANYHVDDVVVDSISQGATNSYTFLNVTNAHTISASFAIDQREVIFVVGAEGTHTGGGTLTQLVDHASAAVAPTITPDTGYNFAGWDASFASVTGDMTVNAQYSLIDYAVAYLAGANGSISGATNQTVSHGNSGTEVTAAADTGYSFVDWSDGITTEARTDNNVTNDISLTANFAINTYTFTVASAYGTPNPSGVTTSEWSTVVDSVMNDATIVNGTTQYVCTGWTGTGSLSSGIGTNVSFTITNDTTITWQWQTNYWINFEIIDN